MKKVIQLGILSNLLINSAAFALNNPIQGFYAGIMAGISHGPASDQVVFEERVSRTNTQRFTGKVTYSSVGGGGGAVLGWKFSHVRLEGELLYNRISTGPLLVDPGGCTLQSPNVFSPTGVCTPGTGDPGTYDRFRLRGLAYSGSSAVTYGLFNVYFDFFSPESYQTVPYVGIGIGKAQIRNFNDFINTNIGSSPSTYPDGTVNPNASEGLSHGHTVTVTTTAVQGILGVSYYMDDFTWAGMDLRYTTTPALTQISDASAAKKSYALTSLNFNINFAFDKGGIDI